jgi:cytidyltransferase-like protein
MKVGFNCSSFDLLHAGHVTMLKMEKELCDYLIVALQVDPTIDRPGSIDILGIANLLDSQFFLTAEASASNALKGSTVLSPGRYAIA